MDKLRKSLFVTHWLILTFASLLSLRFLAVTACAGQTSVVQDCKLCPTRRHPSMDSTCRSHLLNALLKIWLRLTLEVFLCMFSCLFIRFVTLILNLPLCVCAIWAALSEKALHPRNEKLDRKISLYSGDITKLEIDAIVNAGKCVFQCIPTA